MFEMTVLVEAGRDDCYFVPNVTKGQDMNIEFSVISKWRMFVYYKTMVIKMKLAQNILRMAF